MKTRLLFLLMLCMAGAAMAQTQVKDITPAYPRFSVYKKNMA